MPAVLSEWSERSLELSRLLGRAGIGDRAAFEDLYKRTSAHLFAVVLRINRDRGQAEEVLQEVYIKVWHAARTFDAAQGQPLTWLISIARHRAIDSLRRKQTEPQVRSAPSPVDDEDHDVYDDLADSALGPLETLSRASDAQRIANCLKGLTAPQRQSVALAFFDGLSHAEVAERMHQPLGTVKSWVRRALLSLRACLEGNVSPGSPTGGA
ncbi:MAG: polymerase sigma-e factor sigma-24 [Rhizobacter sp.]|nr:polymerase sigma-e factor sigma-24 [Rhizobacter sp.]